MMASMARVAAVALALAGPAGPALAQAKLAAMAPAQAIAAAAAAPNGTVDAVIEMDVGSTGAAGFAVFLNSAKDYRDSGNLTVELHSGAKAALRAQLGGEPEDMLKGKHVRVIGEVHRVAVPRGDGTSFFRPGSTSTGSSRSRSAAEQS